jgi:heme exporter protein C
MRLGGPRIDPSMLVPLLVMAAGFLLLFLTLLLLGMRAALNERKALALRLNSVPAPGRVALERPMATQSPITLGRP